MKDLSRRAALAGASAVAGSVVNLTVIAGTRLEPINPDAELIQLYGELQRLWGEQCIMDQEYDHGETRKRYDSVVERIHKSACIPRDQKTWTERHCHMHTGARPGPPHLKWLLTILRDTGSHLTFRKQCFGAQIMRWNSDRQLDRTSRPAIDSASGVVRFRHPSPPAEGDAGTAIDLVYQAAEVLQSVETRAVETTARAHDLARQAAEQLQLAESRIRALESANNAADAALQDANARADEAEQALRESEVQITALEGRVATAEQRARNGETRAIDAEKALIRIEDAIRTQLLDQRQPVLNRSVAA